MIVPDVFPRQEIADISSGVDHVLAGKAIYLPEKDILYDPDTHPLRVRNAFNLYIYQWKFYLGCKASFSHHCGREYFREPLHPYASQILAKPAHLGTAAPSHQDMPYWPFELLSAWIALDDSTIENGCVRYVAG